MFRTKIMTKDRREITVREPRSADAKQALRHINQQVKDKTEGLNINKPMTLKQERAWLKALIADVRSKKKVFLFLEHDKKIVGSCEVIRRFGRCDHTASFGISVEKPFRRQGLGTQVLPVLFNLAKKRMKGLEIIDLDVFAYNKPGIGLYKKVGFKKVGMMPDAVKNKGRRYPKILMYYYLKR